MDNDKYHCEGCGKDYTSKAGWHHENCVKTKPVVRENLKSGVMPEKPVKKHGRKPKDANNPVRKWDRDSWNAYMKEWMRNDRAKKKGGV